jgi:Ni/Co efflux regulator RcnB
VTLRFRLGQIVLVIALVTGLGATIAARDEDSRSKDSRDSKKGDSRYTDGRDWDHDKDRDDKDHDRRRHDNDRDDDDDDDDDDSHHHGNKVTICHKQEHKGGKTITVSASAVSAHQLHGDTLGPCPSSASR